jgi:HicA toxin of bacterial toxin-antitoxin,
MSHLGYEEVKGGGSRRKFIHQHTRVSVNLHEPHPQPTMKRYAIDLIIEHLKEEGFL